MNPSAWLAWWNGFAERWAGFQTALLLQVTVVVALVALLDRLLRTRARAVVRHALWWLVLAKLLIPPDLALPTSPAYWLRRATPVAGAWSGTPPPVHFSREHRDSEGTVRHDLYALFTGAARPGQSGLTGWGWLLAGWTGGGLVLLGWVVRRSRQVQRWVREAEPAEARTRRMLERCLGEMPGRRVPRLAISDRATGPAVCGVWTPTILLPRGLAESLSDEALRHVLLHELAHVRRRDLGWSQLQTLLLVANWLNPLVWLADRRLRDLREQATDEAVVATLRGEAEAYAATLVEVARRTAREPLPLLGMVGIVEAPSALGRRVRRLLGGGGRVPSSGRLGWRAGLAVAGLAFLALPLSGGPAPQATPTKAGATPSAGASDEPRKDFYGVEPEARSTPSLQEQADAGVTLEPPSPWGRANRTPSVTTWSTNAGGRVLLDLGMEDPREGPAREAWMRELRARFRELGRNGTLLIRAPRRLPHATLVAVMGAAVSEGVRVTTALERSDGSSAEPWSPPSPLVSGTNAASGGELQTRVFRVRVEHLAEGFRRIGLGAESTNLVMREFHELARTLGFRMEPPNAFFLSYGKGLLMARGTASDLEALERALELLQLQLPAMVELAPWVAVLPRRALNPELTELIQAARGSGLPLRDAVARRVRQILADRGANVAPLPRVTTLDSRQAQVQGELEEGPRLRKWKARLDMIPVRLVDDGRWQIEIIEGSAHIDDPRSPGPAWRVGTTRLIIADGDAVLMVLKRTGPREADDGEDDLIVVAMVSAMEIDPAGNRVRGRNQ